MTLLKRYALAVMLVLMAASCIPAASIAHADEPRTIPLVMVVIGFDGWDNADAAVPYDNGYDWANALFGEGESPASYFRNLSAGTFAFAPAPETSAAGLEGNTNAADRANDGIIHVTLHRTHNAWGAVNVERAVTRDFASMAIEALEAASSFIDFPSFDTNGDGALSAQELTVCFCVAGYEASSVTDFRRTDIPLLWSHSGLFSVIDESMRTVNGMKFDTYTAIAERNWTEGDPLETAEQEPLGIVYHELGHALGLPDLYAVSITEGPWADYTVGPLSLMDAGGWQYADDGNGWRNIPTALDAWSRYVLGWTKPAIVTRSGDYVVSSQLSEGGYRSLIIPTNDPHEYFLVENRQPEGYDVSLVAEDGGTDGVVVWHVDNEMYARYYDANQVNDANHRPAVMDQGTGELFLYNNANDVPNAGEPAGIMIQIASSPARDMTVHIELNDRDAARNAAHLLHDSAREDLHMTENNVLSRIIAIMRASIG